MTWLCCFLTVYHVVSAGIYIYYLTLEGELPNIQLKRGNCLIGTIISIIGIYLIGRLLCLLW